METPRVSSENQLQMLTRKLSHIFPVWKGLVLYDRRVNPQATFNFIIFLGLGWVFFFPQSKTDSHHESDTYKRRLFFLTCSKINIQCSISFRCIIDSILYIMQDSSWLSALTLYPNCITIKIEENHVYWKDDYHFRTIQILSLKDSYPDAFY